MPNAFSEIEKEHIRVKLKEAAKECLGKYGVKKTTVDQLVQIAGISKGAFYIFHPSKEVLFFEVLEEYQGILAMKTFGTLNQKNKIRTEEFTNLIYDIYKNVHHSFMMPLIENSELEYLMRKIPEEYILNHHSFDNKLAENLFSRTNLKKDVTPDIAAAALRAIFTTMLHVKEIGEKDFDKVLRLLIAGAAQQLLEEE